MKSKTSFFNKTIFINNLTRFWPIWALYLVIWIFVMPVMLANELRWGTREIMDLNHIILEMANIGGLLCAVSFSVMAAAAVYSFMYTSRSTSFFSSLPIRREGLFITNYLSGITWFLVANVIIVLITMLVEATFGVLSMWGLVQWFFMVSLQMIVFYSIATFCAAVSGNVFGFGILYAALNCIPILLELVIKYIGTLLLRGVSFSEDFFTRFVTPVYMLWENIYTKRNEEGILTLVRYEGWTALLIYAAVGIIFAVIGLMLYRKRHMETASDFIATKKLRPVFKYCATVCCALGLGILLFGILFMEGNFDSAYIPLTLCMLVGGFIGYFASSMMLAKSFRVFKKWRGFAIVTLILILLMVGVRLDVFNIEGYVPKAENVENVAVSYYYETKNIFDDLDDIEDVTAVHSYLLENDERIINQHSWSAEWNGMVHLSYELKNGRHIERDYYIYIENENDELYTMLDELMNNSETIVARNVGDMIISPKTIYNACIYGYDYDTGENYNIELTPEEAYELYETSLLPDMQDGTLGAYNIGGFKNYVSECYISIDTFYTDGNGEEYYNSLYFTIPLEAERTVAKLREMDFPILIYYEDETGALSKIGGANGPTVVFETKTEHTSF